MRKLILFIGLCLSLNSVAQTYTFECVSDARLSGDSCDICPSTIVESRSFNGLVIYRDSTFYRWLDQPYSIRVKPGGIVEYWEHGANPYSERITIPLSLTGFATIQGMADSTWCNSSAPNRHQELSLDSVSAVIAKIRLSGSNTGVGLRAGTGITFDFDNDTLTINASSGGSGTVTSVAATAPSAGFTITGSPITTSGTFVFTLANDLAAIEALSGTGIAVRTGTDTWTTRTLAAGTGISLSNADGVGGNPTITNSAPDQTVSITGAGISVITGTYPNFTVTSTEVDGSTSNELQTVANTSNATSHTATLSNSGGSLQFVEGTGIGLATTGTGLDGVLTITNSSPDQTVVLTGAGINVVTGTYPSFTITGTEVDGSITNEGLLGVGAGGATSSVLLSNTSTASGVTINVGGINAISETTSANGGSITITATEVDGSTTNEIQTYAHSGTTTYTNTLSNGGGSWSLTGAGIATISQTAGAITITVNEGFLGTVTSFSAGNLSPLFTTSVATATTTPALSFTLTNAGANTYFGNATGGAAAPSYTAAAALTKTDDTNVTLTLGGNPNTSLLNAASLTLGWTGTLAVGRGGIGVNTITGIMQGNGTGAVTGIANSSTTGQVLRVTGASAYAWGALDLANTSAVTGKLPFANIADGVARSVFGVSGAAGAHADIQTTGADLPLRTNAGNTAIGWGQLATGAYTDKSVAYAKIQDVTATSRVLGRITAGAGVVEELTAANLYTILGMTGVDQRIAVWKGTTTLGNDAGLTFDYANDRQTINCTAPTLGAGLAALNIANVGTGTDGEFFQARGNMSGNLICGQYNVNTATGNSFYTISQSGNSAGDAFLQVQIAGASGNTTAVGIDNSDGNKFKITPNGATPGVNGNASLVATNDASPLWGINKDTPSFTFDVGGKERTEQDHGISVAWAAGDLSFGLSAGTAPTFTSMVGTHNFVRIKFKTGTAPPANDAIFTITRKANFEFAAKGFPVFCAGNAATAGEITKFYSGSDNGIQYTIRANGALTASTDYELLICFSGY